MLPVQPRSDTFTQANTITQARLDRRTISWTAVKQLLFSVRVSGSPLGYLLGNYTHWSDPAGCVLGAECASLRLLVNTNPLPHSPNCEWQSILWKAVLNKPTTGFAWNFENCQSGPWGIRREVDLTLLISVKRENCSVAVGRIWIIFLHVSQCLKTMSWTCPNLLLRGSKVRLSHTEVGPPMYGLKRGCKVTKSRSAVGSFFHFLEGMFWFSTFLKKSSMQSLLLKLI